MRVNIEDNRLANITEPKTIHFDLPKDIGYTSRSSNKLVSPQHLSIYYTWKNIRKQYKSNKLKIIA